VFSAVRRPPGRLRRALSQTERVRRIGARTSLAEDSSEGQVWYAAFTNGLAELAWTVSHNVQFAYRWAAKVRFFLVFYCAQLAMRNRRSTCPPRS
jgi:hypothetical protein